LAAQVGPRGRTWDGINQEGTMTSTRIHWAAVALSYLVAMLITSALALAAALPTYTIGPITNISSVCSGQNAEVEQAVDRLGRVDGVDGREHEVAGLGR